MKVIKSSNNINDKYVLFSSDNNPDYYFILPIATLAWKNMGYKPLISLVWDSNNLSENKNTVIEYCNLLGADIFIIESQTIIKDRRFNGYNLSMLAQISRFCSSILLPKNSYCLTSDADMIPTNVEWFNQQNFNKKIHLFYANGYEHTRYPICYIGMDTSTWKDVFKFPSEIDIYYALKHLLSDLNRYESNGNQWGYDEILFFKRISKYKEYPHNCHMIDRKIYNNLGFKRGMIGVPKLLPYGRLDRSFWNIKRIYGDLVDIHCMRNPYSRNNVKLLKETLTIVFSKKDYEIIDKYIHKFVYGV